MVISETARLKVTIDFRRGPAHNQRMAVSFDTLAAAEALEAVGVEARQARVFATQLHAAARAGEPVTRPELEKSAAELKTEIAEAQTRLEKSVVYPFEIPVVIAICQYCRILSTGNMINAMAYCVYHFEV